MPSGWMRSSPVQRCRRTGIRTQQHANAIVLLPTQSLSRWHKQLNTSTNAVHGEKFSRQSRPSAAVPSDDQRGEETICFYGGLVNRSNRNTLSSLEESSPLGLLSPSPTPASDLGKELLLSVTPPVSELADTLVDDEATTAWLNMTTILESCSPTPSGPPVKHAPWWSVHSDSLFPEVEVEDDCGAQVRVPGKGRVDVERNRATTGGHGFTNTIVDDPRHMWLRSPTASSISSNITDTELERSLDEYSRGTARGQSKPIETAIDCANLLDELQVELTEPAVSLHEEIEQLSSAFDCDASNHLVSTTIPTNATTLPFVGLPADDGEPISLNILKWLQEEEEANVTYNNAPELCSTSSELVDSLLIDTPARVLKTSPETSTTTHTTGGAFAQSLDQIHNINGLTRGLSKTTTTAIGKRDGVCTTTATASFTTTATSTTTTTKNTTTTTHNTANHSQRDHNYYAMKRRLQEEDIVGEESTPPVKMAKALQPIGDGWVTDDAKFSTSPSTSGLAAVASNGDSSKQHLHAKPSATTSLGRRLSLASRKAPTLAVNVTPRVILPAPLAVGSGQQQTSSTIGGHGQAAAAAALTNTTTTTTTTHEPLRMPPQAATLNTPDLTNDILDLEDEKFDLLSFIDTDDLEELERISFHSAVEEKPKLDLLASPSTTSAECHKASADLGERARNSSKATSGSSAGDAKKQIYQLLTMDSLRQLAADADESTSHATAATGRRTNTSSACSIGSRSSASSVCGDSSSDVSSSTKAPKRRGRPPKVAGTVRDRSQYQHLSEADWRYREQRDKNNEASRKSRINRKDRELKLEMEADRLSAQHQKLSYEERRLQQDCQRWRKAVMKLALL
uniref:BZIP domain-containing protein n=1 Tax=Anopheles culicifacies TaxID=139723 RepID=A0A182MTT1_9DIPT